MPLLSCILFYSHLHGVDPKVTQAVIRVESNWNARAIGPVGEVGLMQVRPEHVRETALQLKDPCTNVRVGTSILRKAMEKCKHKSNLTWLNCYNLGLRGGSRLKHPKIYPYYLKIVSNL